MKKILFLIVSCMLWFGCQKEQKTTFLKIRIFRQKMAIADLDKYLLTGEHKYETTDVFYVRLNENGYALMNPVAGRGIEVQLSLED